MCSHILEVLEICFFIFPPSVEMLTPLFSGGGGGEGGGAAEPLQGGAGDGEDSSAVTATTQATTSNSTSERSSLKVNKYYLARHWATNKTCETHGGGYAAQLDMYTTCHMYTYVSVCVQVV
mgnify:CR=1 FL=1